MPRTTCQRNVWMFSWGGNEVVTKKESQTIITSVFSRTCIVTFTLMRSVPGASGEFGISIAGAKRSRSLWMSHAKIWICPTSTNITDVPSSTQPGSHNDHQCLCNAIGGNLAVGSGSSRTSLPNGCGTPQWMEFYIAGGKSGSGRTSQIGLEKAKTVSIIRDRMKGLGVHISDAGYDFRVHRYCTSKR